MRAAYDEKIAIKRRAKEHSRQLDAKRRKFKQDLEAREAFYKRTKSDEEHIKVELQKLQKDGERLLEEEAFVEKQRIHKLCKQFYKKESRTRDFIIKIRWKTQESDLFNGGYNYDILHKMFSKYGDVVALVVSSAKKGKALVTFANKSAAETALLQIGLIRNPLILSGLWRDTRKRSSAPIIKNSTNLNFIEQLSSGTHLVNGISTSLSFASAPDIFAQARYRMSDAESEVLSDLKKAEERKRLLEDLKAQEGKET